jgi:CBS domain-containing protein
MTTRLITLGIERAGEPPVPWAWLALGSAARHEQALGTDQDHALAYDEQDRPVEEVDRYFAELAGFVTESLADAGLPRCKGDAMATNRAMRRSVQGWVDALREWMRDPGSSGSILSSIVYDFRRVMGPLDPEPELQAAILEARNDPTFLRHLGRRVIDHRPPTGFLRNLVVERKGDHVGRLDVKHRGITIIGNIARLEGVRAGIPAKETLDRLSGAAIAGTLDERVSRELSEAFRFLWEVRLRHQAGQVRGGEPPDDFVDPSTLGPVTRRGLKEAFGVISRAQGALATEFGLRMP